MAWDRSASARMRFGFTPSEWDEALAEMQRALGEVAEARATITYGELVARVAPGRLSARSAGLGVLLGEICAVEDAERGIMLGSVVVRADSGIPGKGYFRHAAELGRNVYEPSVFWQAEVERVWDSYAR